ncbi:MGMT family protein [uncultured Halopseudomonas sp.]|uniref:MGMT family protein n=1 Tax=uncultured Halopseudomonas sp. TaxID=2901193 RepID=UPI0030EB6A15
MTENRKPAAAKRDVQTNSASVRETFWQVLAAVPEGRVTSYGKLAQLAGMGRGARLAGRWLGQLPEGTALPWHRVVNSQGQLSLPPDHPAGQEQYQRLLAEGIIITDRRVDMKRFGWPD